MKTAVVHEWLTTFAGSEKVVEQIFAAIPISKLFVLIDFLDKKDRGFLRDIDISTSFLQSWPLVRNKYRSFLPLMPLAVEQFDMTEYDVVISSSHAVAKGVITGPDQLHISYVHSPMRYAWDLQHQYLREAQLTSGVKAWLARWFLHKLRIWDVRTAHGVDYFIANSYFVARRIKKVYGRDADVIYPPVDVGAFQMREIKEDFYFTASRMVPYKRMDLIVESFRSMPDKKLVVIGDGPEMGKISKLAGPNVTLLGYQDFEVLLDYMQRAKAFIFAAEEDFGIIPVEAQACGTPVIAYGKGGATETVIGLDAAEPTGVFFYRQDVDSLVNAVNAFAEVAKKFSPSACRANAERFGVERFKSEIGDYVGRKWREFGNNKRDDLPTAQR